MSKKFFRTVGKVAGVVAAVAAIGTGIGAALGGTMLLTIGGAAVSTSAIAGAASLVTVGASLLGKPKAQQLSAATTDRLHVTIVADAPLPMAFGTTAFATDLRDQEYTGAEKEYLHRFIGCAAHKCHAVREIWFEDKLAWTLAGGVQAPYAGYLTVTPVLEGGPGNAINISARMGSSRRFTGCTYVHLRFKLTGNTSKTESPFAVQVPTRMTIVGDGIPCYDPRQDDTQPGGEGDHRADDQTTWTWGDHCHNLACQLGTAMLGWRIQNPQSLAWNLAVGFGVQPRRIDWPSFIEGANLCDEAVARAGGGSVPRYRGGGLLTTAQSDTEWIDAFKAAMNADLDDQDGLFRLTVFHNDLATPDADLFTDDFENDYVWNQTPSPADSFNVVRGRYVEPSALFQPAPYAETSVAPAGTRGRVHTADFGLVQDRGQAERLAKQRLQRQVYGGTFHVVAFHRAWKLQKNSIVRVTFAPEGWVNKLFRVAEITVREDGRVQLVLREEHPDIYLWDAEESPAVELAEPTEYLPGEAPIPQFLGTIEEGADVTGDHTSLDTAQVGGVPAEDLVDAIDTATDELAQFAIDMAAANSAIAAAQDQITDLSETYGDTASAAASAALAEAAKDDAAGSATTASTKRDEAAGFAEVAEGHALAASNSAEAAEAQATIATGAAVTATNQASAASTSATLSAYYSKRGPGDSFNGDFSVPAGWYTTDAQVTAYGGNYYQVSGSGRTIFLTLPGVHQNIFGERMPVDPTRKYRVVARGATTSGHARVYLGFVAYDAAGARLPGNGGSYNYSAASYTDLSSTYTDMVSGVITGEGTSNNFMFPVGTRSIAPIGLLNYDSAAGVSVAIDQLYIEDITEQVAAEAQANIATNQAAIATDKAAAAQQSAILSASIGQGALNKNPGFDDYPSGAVGALPTGWGANSGMGGCYRTVDAQGGYGWRIPAAAGVNVYSAQSMAGAPLLTTGGYYVIEADVICRAGSFAGAAVLFRPYNQAITASQDLVLLLNSDPDATGSAVPAPVVGRAYSFRKLVKVTLADAYGFHLFVMSHWGTSGSGGIDAANDIEWLKCLVRPATQVEIRDQTVLAPLQASVSQQSSALATLDSQYASLDTAVTAQGVTVSEHTSAIAAQGSELAAMAGQWALAIDINGKIVGRVRLDGTASASLFEVTTDIFRLSPPGGTVPYVEEIDGVRKVVTATNMYVTGAPFGTSDQFVMWYGPRTTGDNPALCTETNALTFIRVDGAMYFGGAVPNMDLVIKDVLGTIRTTAFVQVGTIISATTTATGGLTAQWDGQASLYYGTDAGCEYKLQYSPDKATWTDLAGSSETATVFAEPPNYPYQSVPDATGSVSGLTANRIYHVRMVARLTSAAIPSPYGLSFDGKVTVQGA